jgi:hypothetical protein
MVKRRVSKKNKSIRTEGDFSPFFWPTLTQEEKVQHYQDIIARLLEHRYRYYYLDESVIEDFVYDFLEKKYFKWIANDLGLPDVTETWVDWNEAIPGAKEARERVDNNTDHYSLSMAPLIEVWKLIGAPVYKETADERKKRLTDEEEALPE